MSQQKHPAAPLYLMSVDCCGQTSEPAGFLPEFLDPWPYLQVSVGPALAQWDRYSLHKERNENLFSASLIYHEVICFFLMFPSCGRYRPPGWVGAFRKSSLDASLRSCPYPHLSLRPPTESSPRASPGLAFLRSRYRAPPFPTGDSPPIYHL